MGSGGTKVEKLDKQDKAKNSKHSSAENSSRDRVFSSFKFRNGKVSESKTWATKPDRKENFSGKSHKTDIPAEESSTRSEFSHLLSKLKNIDSDGKSNTSEKAEGSGANCSDITLERYSPEPEPQNINNNNDEGIEREKVNKSVLTRGYAMNKDHLHSATSYKTDFFTESLTRNEKALPNRGQPPLPAPRISLLTNKGGMVKTKRIFFNKPCYIPQSRASCSKVADAMCEQLHSLAKEDMVTEEEIQEIEKSVSATKLQTNEEHTCRPIEYSEEELELMKSIEMEYFKPR